MKKSTSISLIMLAGLAAFSQKNSGIDSLEGFNNDHFLEHVQNVSTSEKNVLLRRAQRNYIRNKYYPPVEKVFPLSASSSTCGNMDFEDGNAGGWTITGDYQIMSGSGLDPFGGFPVVCPGGNFSLRLNDNNTNASTCSPPGTKSTFTASASTSLNITSANSMIKIEMAACFLAFPHTTSDAAYLGVEFFDAFNNALAVPTFTAKYTNPANSIISSSPLTAVNGTIQGSQVCNYGQYPVSYFPWHQKQFDLSAYIGQTIKIKLSANWCLYQYDWGYAYFDLCCDNTCPYVGPTSQTKNYYVCTNTPFSMNACTNNPFNINYQWYDSSGPISTASCIPVNAYGNYTLTSIHPSSPSFTMIEVHTYTTAAPISFSILPSYCNSSSSVPLFASPSGGNFFGTNVSGNSFTPSTPGTYSITYTYTNSTGCSSTLTQTTNVVTCTDVKNYERSNEYIVSPNPFSDRITVFIKGFPEGADFVLFNTLGQEIIRKRIDSNESLIDTSILPSGLYIYTLFSQNKPIRQGKLVKE